MTAPIRHEGVVIRRDPAGERHLRLCLLDPQHGVVTFLHRPAAKTGSPTVTPDLFDDAELYPDSPKGGATTARFVKEYRLIRRRSGLSREYVRLELACRLSLLLADNPHPADSWPALHTLACAALDALETRPAPEATFLKFLWKLACNEGWPVREHFVPALPPPLAAALRTILVTPLDAIPAESTPAVRELTHRLEQWLVREAHYVVKPT